MATFKVDHCNSNDENVKRDIKTYDSARLVDLDSIWFDSSGVNAFPHVAVISRLKSLCRVLVIRIRLGSLGWVLWVLWVLTLLTVLPNAAVQLIAPLICDRDVPCSTHSPSWLSKRNFLKFHSITNQYRDGTSNQVRALFYTHYSLLFILQFDAVCFEQLKVLLNNTSMKKCISK
jgi:hypothetical protein